MTPDLPEPLGTVPGGPGTMEALFLALEGPLLCYGIRLLRNREMAEDVVQEAFLRLQSQEDTIREPRGWLYRTVHNLAMNQLRSEARLVSVSQGSADDRLPQNEEAVDLQLLPDEQLARWEAIGRVRLGLESLDARSRNIVFLKFSENLSYEQISERTGLKSGYVGYLLHHALKTLSEDLSQAGLLP